MGESGFATIEAGPELIVPTHPFDDGKRFITYLFENRFVSDIATKNLPIIKTIRG